MFYPMLADIFYSKQVQKDSGLIERTWIFGKSAPCELKTGRVGNSEINGSIDTANDFFILSTMLYGRFLEDIRIGPNKVVFPITEIAITNIRSKKTGDILFAQPKDTIDELIPTIYELRNINPFINMWGKAEHFKVQLIKSDNQEAHADDYN